MATAESSRQQTGSLAFDNFVFDPVERRLRKNGVLLKVDSRQLELLEVFLHTPQRVLTRFELLDRVWQRKFIGESALSVCVAKLRKALGRTPRGGEYIENRYGKGYRFCATVVVVPHKTLVASTTDASTADAPVRSSVGRSDMGERLRAALDGAIMGKGSFVTLMGEPGIGKTHLAEILEQESQSRGVRTVWGRLPTDSGLPPLWPFVQLVRELGGDDYANEILRVWSDAAEAPNMEAPSSAERH
ncbi:MAG TPA: winged helix-turn-helix domain-containing protein, partial [Polyangiales bacterium]|nr:winged helix-turn-helix domain-containing protein [Polyangiales bacterium]